MSDPDTRLSGKKRAAETQLNPDNVNQVEPEEESNEPMVADAAVLATRKIRKVRRPPGMEEPEDRQGGSELSKAFASATTQGAKPISAAFSMGFGSAAKPAEAKSDAPVTFGFGTAPATSSPKAADEKKAAPVSFGFGTTPAAPTTGEKKEEKKDGPVTFGFGVKTAAPASKPAAAESGSPVGIMAKASTGSLGSVFGGGSASEKEAAPPAGGFAFKVPDGCAAPETAAPKVQTLPGEAEVDLKTGEEGETAKFTATAKLSERQGDSWAQRGTGEMKINQKDGAEAKDGNSRLVMRDAATKRALLNCPLKTGFKIAKSDKNALIFTFVEPGDDGTPKTRTYLLKIPDTGALPGDKAMAQVKELIEAALA